MKYSEILATRGYTDEVDMRDYVDLYAEWYTGYCKEFHSYTEKVNTAVVAKERVQSGLVKQICEDLTSLILSELEFSITDKQAEEYIREVLDNNNYNLKYSDFIEGMFALGNCATVQYIEDDNIKIDYIDGDVVFPLSERNGIVTEIVVLSETIKNDKKYTLAQWHLSESGQYSIYNELYDDKAKVPLEVVYENMEEVVNVGTTYPQFQYYKPNIKNNKKLRSAYGVSVYGNALSLIQSFEMVLDDFINEYDLARLRIMISDEATELTKIDDGTFVRQFDKNNTVYKIVNGMENIKEMILPINFDIRDQSYINALNTFINMISIRVGLGDGYYEVTPTGAVQKTATEIISTANPRYKNAKKHQEVIKENLKRMLWTIYEMGVSLNQVPIIADLEIKVNFNDSILEDTEAVQKRKLAEVQQGIETVAGYYIKVYGMTEEEAKEKEREVREAKASSAQEVVDFLGRE